MPNRLITSTSPYLLQHAYNPVDWYPWGPEALNRAKSENKLILLSIGYSACHWCHVMEKNCFENDAIAAIMNQHFINIKVDREERPDVDHVYMDALHLMGSRGGWPLNVFLTPDQLPFYGGTYFPPEQWVQVLEELALVHQRTPDELLKIGENLRNGLQVSELKRYLPGTREKRGGNVWKTLLENLKKLELEYDSEWGGFGQAPKFPMPSQYEFLLFYHHITGDSEALNMVSHSLTRMACGGICDQLGGGFARYSVDSEWKIPHFEKMLYDNAQLLSLYSHAFTATQTPLFKEVAYGIVSFVRNELTARDGGFYSALDADSEGEEGKFYAWTREEILTALGESGEWFCRYFQVTESGNFETSTNVLWKYTDVKSFAEKENLPPAEFEKRIEEGKKILLEKRNLRVRPGLDDKILTSWNALMLKGLVDAYRAFDEPDFLQMAYNNAVFLKENMLASDGRLLHTFKNGRAHIDGFLDDYAFLIEAFVSLYEASFHEEWLLEAKKLADHAIHQFYDPDEGLFFYTSHAGQKLIARKKEIMDNVIPGSNSAMAMGLQKLGTLFFEDKFKKLVQRMLETCEPLITREIRYMSHWLQVWLMDRFPMSEVAIAGRSAVRFRKELDKAFHPNKIVCGTTTVSPLPLLENRISEDGKTQVFVCQDRVCHLPADTVGSALRQLKIIRDEMRIRIREGDDSTD